MSDDPDYAALGIAELVDCIDCGGRCHLLRLSVPEDPEPGDVIQYRCEDCLDCWYLVIPGEDGA